MKSSRSPGYLPVLAVSTGDLTPVSVVQLWMQIFQHIIAAMLFFQIIMIALFGIKKAPGPAALTAPLPFITVAFLLYNLKLFSRPQVIISNRTAADIDQRQSQVTNACAADTMLVYHPVGHVSQEVTSLLSIEG